ncbi:MAG: right-handed parallel beta-helix repeat-containing protein [bacterium]|nr:right-handed parallel beta-helix repeat-containing protein [bacterium]
MRQLFTLLILCLPLSSILADTYTVSPDGTGDYPTIQAAMDDGHYSDIIELTDGIFTGEGNRDLDFNGRSFTILSQSGNPENCIIDCEGSETDPHRGFHFHSWETAGAIVRNITIRNGWAESEHYGTGGGAVYCEGWTMPYFDGCVFSNNGNSAILSVEECAPYFIDCVFRDNQGFKGGGICVLAGAPQFYNCEFSGNSAEITGAALHNHGGNMTFTGCVFRNNFGTTPLSFIYNGRGNFANCLITDNDAAGSYLGTIIEFHGFGVGFFTDCIFSHNVGTNFTNVINISKMSFTNITGCTFVNNQLNGGAVIACSEISTSVRKTIIAFNDGAAVTGSREVSLTCCDIFGNSEGDWTADIVNQFRTEGNISADPLFCDPANDEYTLHATSPCAPENNDCGELMGARAVACGLVAAEAKSWSDIKALY